MVDLTVFNSTFCFKNCPFLKHTFEEVIFHKNIPRSEELSETESFEPGRVQKCDQWFLNNG